MTGLDLTWDSAGSNLFWAESHLGLGCSYLGLGWIFFSNTESLGLGRIRRTSIIKPALLPVKVGLGKVINRGRVKESTINICLGVQLCIARSLSYNIKNLNFLNNLGFPLLPGISVKQKKQSWEKRRLPRKTSGKRVEDDTFVWRIDSTRELLPPQFQAETRRRTPV